MRVTDSTSTDRQVADSVSTPSKRTDWLGAAGDLLQWGAIGLGSAGSILAVGALVLAGDIDPGQGTVLGGLGVLTAGGLTYYASHRARASTESIEKKKATQAADQLDQARNQFEQQHQFEQDRVAAEQRSTTERELRARFTASVSQLADASPTIRLAGVYSLVALGDDWYSLGSDDQREVCVELLASYLRTPQTNPEPDADDAAPHTHVRATIARVIAERKNAPSQLTSSWHEVKAATLTRADLRRTDLREAALTNVDLSGAQLGDANLVRADLRGADVSSADFTRATLHQAKFTAATIRMTKLNTADLTDATFDDTELRLSFLRGADLSGASLRGATVIATTFTDAVFFRTDLRGADLGRSALSAADLSEITYDDATVWPRNFTPPEPSVPRDAEA